MIETQTSHGVMHPTAEPAMSDRRAFHQWLRLQLRARKMTQRQLAQKSGVDHSTVSRLMRGDRTPSLRTATLLARGLGLPQDPGWLDGQSFGRSDSPAARVEHALRSDDLLVEMQVRAILDFYLAARLRRAARVDTPVPVEAAGTTRVPIIVRVAAERPRLTPVGRPPGTARGRSS
jgi:transcriptional regulator with XRE-family HTH domain